MLAAAMPGTRVGGSPAQDADFITALYGRNLAIITAIVIATFLLLARALRSLWLPVKALLLNLLSLAAAFGVLTFVWQQGHGTGTLFASPATGAVTLWVPLAVFALLFGLSMDYEVFILTRITEAYEKTADTNQAVIRGIGRTGRLVPSGALILCLAFIALGGVPVTDVKNPLHRAGRRNHHRRHPHPRNPRPRPRRPPRPLQLVATRADRPAAAHHTAHPAHPAIDRHHASSGSTNP